MQRTKVLFLCTGNSARSQMAEAFLHHYGAQRFEAFSAGLDPQGINLLTAQVMAEIGVSMEGQYSKALSRYLGKEHFGYLITVCGDAEERCPSTFPGLGKRLRWCFDDPATVEGSAEEKLAKFRAVRDAIGTQIQRWIQEV